MPQRDAGALMRHIIKQRQLLDAARALSDATRMTQTRIYVGLNDAERTAVKKIASELCDRFGQESVLVTEEPIRGYFLKGG
ncbi:MAG: hypothetical protein IJT18_04700 [Oscillospiraceae bacterium]|nr:hypothetical protein [Oscillospiraceae bacterium]